MNMQFYYQTFQKKKCLKNAANNIMNKMNTGFSGVENHNYYKILKKMNNDLINFEINKSLPQGGIYKGNRI